MDHLTHQFGFRKNISTENAIVQLTKTIANAININKKCLTVFLDLRKAFDTIDPLLLLSRLRVIGVRGITLEVFRSYMSNMQQCTKINEAISNLLAVTRGVPQGTVLGPTLLYSSQKCRRVYCNFQNVHLSVRPSVTFLVSTITEEAIIRLY